MSLSQLNQKRFEEIIYDKGEACLVVFSRKDCHVCQALIPVVEEMQPNYEGKFGFYYVDVEEDKPLYQSFSLKGVPQILFFKEGEYQGKLAGKIEEEQIEENIDEILSA